MTSDDAVPTPTAVEKAQVVLEQVRRFTVQLQEALTANMVVERAVGIVMSRSGVNEDKARLGLRTLAEREHTKLVVVAQKLVDDAVRRAQGRHLE